MTVLMEAKRRRLKRPGLTWVGAVAVAQAFAAWQGMGPPVQPILPLLFVLTVPGFILLDLSRPADRTARFLLAIGASLGTNVVLVSVLLLPMAIWMVPTAAVSGVGLWKVLRVRQKTEEAPPEDLEVSRDAGDSVDAQVSHEPRPPSGVSWKQRSEPGVSTSWDPVRKKRPFEKLTAPDRAPDWIPVTASPTPADPGGAVPAAPSPSQPEAPVAQGPLAEAIRAATVSSDENLGAASPTEEKPASDIAGDVTSGPELVDLNSADLAELATLPGFGPRLAGRLIEYRDEHGPFKALEDLQGVAGVGPAKAAGVADRVRFGASPQHEDTR